MTQPQPKWRVIKRDGRWIVRKPNGQHHGTYLTYAEAKAQATQPRTHTTAGCGGYFDRTSQWDWERRRPFGFAQPTMEANQ